MTRQTVYNWTYGLAGAALNSSASAATILIVDPFHFEDWRKLLTVMAASAAMGAFLYLKQHPLPCDPDSEN